MKIDDVPQETSRTYGGVRKLLYAVDGDGTYRGVNSSGWDVETYATVAAVDELERLRDRAWARANDGIGSALEFHMYRARMDPPQLAAAAGLWQWRVKRHLRVAAIRKLNSRILKRYAAALQLTFDELVSLPDSPNG